MWSRTRIVGWPYTIGMIQVKFEAIIGLITEQTNQVFKMKNELCLIAIILMQSISLCAQNTKFRVAFHLVCEDDGSACPTLSSLESQFLEVQRFYWQRGICLRLVSTDFINDSELVESTSDGEEEQVFSATIVDEAINIYYGKFGNSITKNVNNNSLGQPAYVSKESFDDRDNMVLAHEFTHIFGLIGHVDELGNLNRPWVTTGVSIQNEPRTFLTTEQWAIIDENVHNSSLLVTKYDDIAVLNSSDISNVIPSDGIFHASAMSELSTSGSFDLTGYSEVNFKSQGRVVLHSGFNTDGAAKFVAEITDDICVWPASADAVFKHGDSIISQYSGEERMEAFESNNVSLNAFIKNTFPNPTTGLITYNSTAPLGSATVMDLTGRALHTVSLSGVEGPVSIDLSPYRPGTYLLRVQYQSGKVEVHRVVRQ